VISVEGLHKGFNGLHVLRGATFRVEKGELLALIGASGEGKSVLLKHIPGLMRPDQGRVRVGGQEVGQLWGRELERLRSRLGFLFQNGALFDSMTVYDNVAFPLREKLRLGETECRQRVAHALEQVGLADAGDKLPAELSGGMARRAALARALVAEPEIMLFDEPTTALDPMIKMSILKLIAECHRRFGFTGILVSHDVPEVFGIVQRVAFLHEGVIRLVGTPEEVLASPDPVVREFMQLEAHGPGSRLGAWCGATQIGPQPGSRGIGHEKAGP